MPYSNTTQLVTPEDVTTALRGDSSVLADDITFAVAATKAYVARYHDTPYVDPTGDPLVVNWPYDYKLGAVKLATALVKSGFSAAINADPSDPLVQSSLGRLTDIEIEQLLEIGRFATPLVG